MNRITATGTLGRKPELKTSKGGLEFTKFPIAVWQGKDKPDAWVDVVVFGNLAERCADVLNKGDKVVVVGRLEISSFEKDGVEQKRATVVADEVASSISGHGSSEPADDPF